MKKVQRNLFKVSPVTAAIALVLATPFISQVALAGSGFGAGVDTLNQPVTVPTYYANSPAGAVPKLDPITGLTTFRTDTATGLSIGLPVMVDTGKALRKFVDKLPGIPGLTPATVGGAAFGANGLGQYIPLAKPEKWIDPNGVTTADDYYEIAAVEFSEKMHSDLPKATRLRGYVQLSTAKNPGKHIQLFYPAVGAAAPAPILDAAGTPVYAYDNPHHLGPIITSAKGTAVRVKFTNYLPFGAGGELFVPVDITLTGAGMGPDGLTPYTQNRAEIHLVGGQSPWISAGTPHQWVAPVGETTLWTKGASAQNVPDMPDPGAGSTTLYFPNDMSARFTFMQDRTSGLTRLNSYAGLEAGYLVTDTAEAALVASGAIPADQIPLIIEDKTFVPANIGQQDAKWDTTHWGQPGDLWFPHVYEANQDPTSIDGTNPVGRWDYGPLFWPIFPARDPLPTGVHGDASFTPEAFHDTPVINGTAYPTLTVDPKAYRLRILNASNDRYINLGLYRADPTGNIAPQLDANGNPILSADGGRMYFTNTEVKMVPAVGDAAGNPVGWDAVNGVQLPLPKYPTLKTNINAEPSGPSRAWPVDGRIGGAPDPTTAGPDFIVIGNDGGLLPNPVDVPAQPITYEANRRSITVGNIYGYGLLLGPAERSDAIVDFSAYAGKTLILYNDAPAPAPFNDVRDDYFTGGPDQTSTGGSYSTKPGYGPNTRTMMQIVVRNTATTPYSAAALAALVTGLPAAYGASQPNPIVPAVAYNAAFGTNDTDIYAHVATGSAAQPTLDFSTSLNGVVTLTGLTLVTSGGQVGGAGNPIPGSGTGYDPLKPPVVVFNNTVNGVTCLSANGVSASATAVVDPGTRQVTQIANFNPGAGYTCAPTVTFTNPAGTSGVGAQVTVQSTNMSTLKVFTKAEQELFDNRGRYNATGGVELPLTNGVIQTTVPLNYMDSATETIKDGEVQVWKLVDNGLWTNSMHFNMVDVQLINRVGWDGTVKAPSSNEVGWKDTLRLNPLEDVIVAMRAKRPQVPFGQPQSQRLLDPSKPVDTANFPVPPALPVAGVQYASGLGFTVAAGLGTPIANRNVSANFDNEFAWGSAILSHAENDLTRPIVYQPTVVKPDAPTALAKSANGLALTWVDPTPAGQVASAPGAPVTVAATLANVQNEIGFTIQRASYAADGITLGAYAQVGAVPANVTSFADPALLVPNTKYSYIVSAWNTSGSTPSGASDLTIVFPPPTGLSATPLATLNIAGVYVDQVNLSWADHSNGLAAYQVLRGGVVIATLPVGSTTYTDSSVLDGTAYSYQVVASLNGNTASSNTVAVTTPGIAINAPTLVTATAGAYSAATNTVPVTVRWTDNATNETAYLVEESTDGGVTWVVAMTVVRTGAATTGTGAVAAPARSVAPGKVYSYRVTAQNKPSDSATAPAAAPVDLTAPLAPTAPSGLTATLASATRVALAWVDNANNENSYLVTITNTTTNVVTTATVTRTAAQSLATGGALVTYNATVVAGNSYSFTVVAQATRFGLTTQSTTAAGPATMVVGVPTAPTIGTAVGGAAGSISVNWVDNSSNESGFAVQRSLMAVNGTWGAWANAGTVAAGVQTFLNTGLTTGRSYRYQVRANGVVGNSIYVGPSNTVVAP